jgi:hypothetical protein
MVAIFTHSHDLDYRPDPRGPVAQRSSPSSAHRLADQSACVRRRLKDEGVSEAELARLTCPSASPS